MSNAIRSTRRESRRRKSYFKGNARQRFDARRLERRMRERPDLFAPKKVMLPGSLPTS